jgi:drug/metabolite transporter (DMT)-like permease
VTGAGPGATAALSLGSAAAWGAGDFTGGLASKRAHVFSVLVGAHASGIVLLSTIALAIAEPAPSRSALAWGAAAGLAGAVGLASLYRALSVGKMGLAAPVSAVLTAVLPVCVGIGSQGLPQARQLAGFALAAASIWLIARGDPSPGESGGPGGTGSGATGPGGTTSGGTGSASAQRRGLPRELPMAMLAGVGFSAYLVLTQRAGTVTVLWPLVMARAASLSVGLCGALALRQNPLPRDPGSLRLALLSGLLDSSGNALFVVATHVGRLDVAGVLASLYPVSTVVLARIVLRERFGRVQSLGMAAALLAIPLIAA